MARPEAANPWGVVKKPKRNNWATFLDGDEDGATDGDLVILPPSTERTQDGIKTITQYKEEVNEENGEVKYFEVIESYHLMKVKRRISKHAKKRKNLPKFGKCADVGAGPEKGITTRCPEHIPVEWEQEKEAEQVEDDPLNKMFNSKTKAGAILVELAGNEVIQQEKKQQITVKKVEPMGRFGGRKPYSSNTEDMEETPTIRILDIPRNTSFQDLLQLVSGFRSKRIKLPRDQLQQDQNRGFAFVTFDSYSDAKQAKERLHGHPYGTNILHCEWSRNYLNFLKANPEIQKALESGNASFARRGPSRFFNSSHKKT